MNGDETVQSLGAAHSVAEQRGAARQRVHGSAQVVLSNQRPLSGRLFDISPSGVSIYLDVSLPHGAQAHLQLQIFRNGKCHAIQFEGRSMYSLLSSKDGFRNGFDFVKPDPSSLAKLAECLA